MTAGRGSPRGRGDVGFVPLDPDLDRGWGRETREWGWGSCGGSERCRWGLRVRVRWWGGLSRPEAWAGLAGPWPSWAKGPVGGCIYLPPFHLFLDFVFISFSFLF